MTRVGKDRTPREAEGGREGAGDVSMQKWGSCGRHVGAIAAGQLPKKNKTV